MTERENFFSLVHRQGYDHVPYDFQMCPDISQRFNAWCEETGFKPDFIMRSLPYISCKPIDEHAFEAYYKGVTFKEGTVIDGLGVAHEPGSEYAFHMTKMYHPLQNADSVEEILSYPFQDYTDIDMESLRASRDELVKQDRIAVGHMEITIWETSWYLRGMNELMMDMLSDELMAEALLDKITNNAVLKAQAYARAGADVIFLGDDVGMQRTIMMSEDMYCEWLKPRLKKVIDAAKAIKPDVLIFYHSCGYVLPLIDHLIDAGVDVLDPVQPECMDFQTVHERFADRLSFHGTIGTQSTMPFGTAQEVRDMVFRNLDIAGEKGGLLVGPTHVLEPEVPTENLVAYIRACMDYRR